MSKFPGSVMVMTGAEVPDAFDRAFDDEELATWSALATLLEWLPAALDAQLQRDGGISHFEFGVLFALSRAEDETLRMTELAGYANSTLSRLSRAIGRLERRDWAHRATDPTDGRSTIVTLSPQGRDAMRSAQSGHVALVRRLVFESLTPGQAKRLGDSARRITSAIREDGGWRPPG